jgi:hypothetical protein
MMSKVDFSLGLRLWFELGVLAGKSARDQSILT